MTRSVAGPLAILLGDKPEICAPTNRPSRVPAADRGSDWGASRVPPRKNYRKRDGIVRGRAMTYDG